MFSDIINGLLQKHNITAYKLSKDIGVSEAVISKWKSGIQDPKYDNLQKLSNYFNVSADYLLGISNNSNEMQAKQNCTQMNTADIFNLKKNLRKNIRLMNEQGLQRLSDYSDDLIINPLYIKNTSKNTDISNTSK